MVLFLMAAMTRGMLSAIEATCNTNINTTTANMPTISILRPILKMRSTKTAKIMIPAHTTTTARVANKNSFLAIEATSVSSVIFYVDRSVPEIATTFLRVEFLKFYVQYRSANCHD